MKIVAFAGSTSSTSINRKLITHTLTHFDGDDTHHLDLRDFTMPIYSQDEERKNTPEPAYAFLKAMQQADAIICSFAEHNGNFSTAFKNVFDWASRINKNVFDNKPMLLMATSPGARGGKNVLSVAQNSLPHYGADIKAVFSLPQFRENFDEEKGIVSPELRESFEKSIEKFKKEIRA